MLGDVVLPITGTRMYYWRRGFISFQASNRVEQVNFCVLMLITSSEAFLDKIF